MPISTRAVATATPARLKILRISWFLLSYRGSLGAGADSSSWAPHDQCSAVQACHDVARSCHEPHDERRWLGRDVAGTNKAMLQGDAAAVMEHTLRRLAPLAPVDRVVGVWR